MKDPLPAGGYGIKASRYEPDISIPLLGWQSAYANREVLESLFPDDSQTVRYAEPLLFLERDSGGFYNWRPSLGLGFLNCSKLRRRRARALHAELLKPFLDIGRL